MPGQGYIHELLPLLDGILFQQITQFAGYPILPAGVSREILHFEKQKAEGINGWIDLAHLSSNNPDTLVKIEVDRNIMYFSHSTINAVTMTSPLMNVRYDVPNSVFTTESTPETVPTSYGSKVIITLINPTATPIIIYSMLFSVLSIVNRRAFIESLNKVLGANIPLG